MGSGKVSAMMNQWNTVKKSLQEEEEEQAKREVESYDPEVRQLACLY
jgi:DNA-binding protein YbaB